MVNQNILDLIEKFLAGKATDEEKTILTEWYRSTANKDAEIWLKDPLEKDAIRFGMLGELQKQIAVTHPHKRHRWRWVAAASIITLLAGSYFIFFTGDKKDSANPKTIASTTDLAPGRDGAILTTAEGKIIVLDNAANGSLTQQGNTEVIKNGAMLSYDDKNANEVVYNTLTTPRGRKFDLVLADGTKVSLDAASSITYPTSFTGHERKIEITGQAYFEVAKDASKPFKVRKGDAEVTVLGTHFNVNAYDDEENINITLLEGVVKVSKGTSSGILKPGQQARIGNEIKVLNGIDTDAVMAWRNGMFHFEKSDIKSLLRIVSRWYDVDIVYEGKVPGGTISGEAQRTLTFSQMQKVLQLNNVQFKIEGKKLIVQ